MDVVIDDTVILEDRIIDDPPVLRGLRWLSISTENIARELGVTPGRVRQFRNANPPTDSQLSTMRVLLADAIEEERVLLLKRMAPKKQELLRRISLEAAKDLLALDAYGFDLDSMPEAIRKRLVCRYAADTKAYAYDKLEDGTAVLRVGTVGTLGPYLLQRGPIPEDADPETYDEPLPGEGGRL